MLGTTLGPAVGIVDGEGLGIELGTPNKLMELNFRSLGISSLRLLSIFASSLAVIFAVSSIPLTSLALFFRKSFRPKKFIALSNIFSAFVSEMRNNNKMAVAVMTKLP